MQGSTIIKILIAVVLVAVIWKKGIPWWQAQRGTATTSATATADDSCVSAAERASEVWGSGLRNFVNPPYDIAAWDEFRSRTDQAISAAERKCSCNADSCTTAKSAMSELRALIGEMDSSIRYTSPPPVGIVQRQEQIDNAISSARDLVSQGK
jgi:hypothetical protein